MHPSDHARTSARLFGGKPDEYTFLHEWFDATKEHFADFRHRALRHHAEGIFECERLFGVSFVNSAGKTVYVRYVAEQHVKEDCGGEIPTIARWLSRIKVEPWMAKGYPSLSATPLPEPPSEPSTAKENP
jgi:hypothetical protein